MKKIIYVITKSNWGGAQKYVYDLVTNLSASEFESIVVFGGTGSLALRLSEKNEKIIPIAKLGRDVNLIEDISSFFKLLSIFKKEKPDIVHVNSSKVSVLGALAARIARVPRIIFTCHGWPFNENRSALSLFIIKFFSWLTIMLCHTTIVVSQRDLMDGKKLLWAKNKIKLVHNGIKAPIFKEKNQSRLEITDLAKNKGVVINEKDFLIGAIGELHRNKAYEYALKAMEILHQKNIPVKFIVFGEGEEEEFLESLLHKFDLKQKVALLGFVKEAPQYLRAFDAFVLCSIKEGLPYVLIEAGFAGLPVVATDVGGAVEIVEDMKSGILVQPRKPEDMAEALEFLHKDHEKALELGQNLKQKVEHDFLFSKMLQKTIELY